MKPENLLIVDDEEQITELLAKYLSLEGYEVTTCNDPIEALKLVKERDFATVITDVMMPHMNGVEFIEKVKAHNALIQCIAITGYITLGNILEAFRNGANNMFFKPFQDLDQIKKEVELATSKIRRIKSVMIERLDYTE